MKNRKPFPEIQAGTTADIAFLLLIFFLVSTTFSKDEGIARTLPLKCPTKDCATTTKRRNILMIQLNAEGELLINDHLRKVSELKNQILDFIDNNGSGHCDYCMGRQVDSLSESPDKAILYVKAHPESEYQYYIEVQNEISKAYVDIRQRMALATFGKNLNELSNNEMKLVKKAYPLFLSEWETP